MSTSAPLASREVKVNGFGDQTDFGSVRHNKMNKSSLVGTILAGRFKILKTIDVDSFKAHDLVLDQTVASAILRGFDRDTRWLATGVLGGLVFGAFLLAVPFPEHYGNTIDPTKAVQARAKLLLNTNISAVSKEVGMSGKASTGETTPRQASGVDHPVSEVSQKENRTSQMEAAASTPTPVLALTPEINHINAQVAASIRSPAHRQDHARSVGFKIIRTGSGGPVRPKFVDVKMRVIALWHRSIRSERPRTWTLFSNLSRGERKKVGYTITLPK